MDSPRVAFLLGATVKCTVSLPWMTQSVAWRETRAAETDWAPVRRPLLRMWTMLGGRSGNSLPSAATPEGPVGTRSTRCVRRTPVCSRTASITCARFIGLLNVGLSRMARRVA